MQAQRGRQDLTRRPSTTKLHADLREGPRFFAYLGRCQREQRRLRCCRGAVQAKLHAPRRCMAVKVSPAARSKSSWRQLLAAIGCKGARSSHSCFKAPQNRTEPRQEVATRGAEAASHPSCLWPQHQLAFGWGHFSVVVQLKTSLAVAIDEQPASSPNSLCEQHH